MKTNWMWVALLTLVWASFSSAVQASCYEPNYPVACITNDGCPGKIDCVSGRPTPCFKNNPRCPTATNPSDLFIGLNAPLKPVGILVDGQQNNVQIDDKTFLIAPKGGTASKELGAMQSSLLGNEVLSFAAERAPTRHLTPWTAGQDTFRGSMENTVRVPITVWILTAPGTFAAQEIQAFSTVADAGALFDQERLGLDFNDIDVRDETNNPNRGAFLNVTDLNAIKTQIGHVNGRFNVYWVEAANNGSGNGIGEVAHGDSVAVGSNAAPGLLAHELGHNLALDHIDGDARFDGSNVMRSVGGTRLFFTEGQAYRAHIRSISAIRSKYVYGLRPTMPIIDSCNISFTSRDCPRADKRIWADGPNWPAN